MNDELSRAAEAEYIRRGTLDGFKSDRSWKAACDWLYAKLSGAVGEFKPITQDEMELLRLSTGDGPGHGFAADFRIGFRYGWSSGDKARFEQMAARVGLAEGAFGEVLKRNAKLEARIEELESSLAEITAKLEGAEARLQRLDAYARSEGV